MPPHPSPSRVVSTTWGPRCSTSSSSCSTWRPPAGPRPRPDHRGRGGQDPRRRGSRHLPHPRQPRGRHPAADQRPDRHHERDGGRRRADRGRAPLPAGVPWQGRAGRPQRLLRPALHPGQPERHGYQRIANRVVCTARLARKLLPATRSPTSAWPPWPPTSGPPSPLPPGHDRRQGDRRRVPQPAGAGRLLRRARPRGPDRVPLGQGGASFKKVHLADDLPAAPGCTCSGTPPAGSCTWARPRTCERGSAATRATGGSRSPTSSELAAIDHQPCATELEASVREVRLIQHHRPRYNRRGRNPERYCYLKLTRERFPRLSLVRRVQPDGARYLGPFGSAAQAELVKAAIEDALPLRRCTMRIGARGWVGLCPAGAGPLPRPLHRRGRAGAVRRPGRDPGGGPRRRPRARARPAAPTHGRLRGRAALRAGGGRPGPAGGADPGPGRGPPGGRPGRSRRDRPGPPPPRRPGGDRGPARPAGRRRPGRRRRPARRRAPPGASLATGAVRRSPAPAPGRRGQPGHPLAGGRRRQGRAPGRSRPPGQPGDRRRLLQLRYDPGRHRHAWPPGEARGRPEARPSRPRRPSRHASGLGGPARG